MCYFFNLNVSKVINFKEEIDSFPLCFAHEHKVDFGFHSQKKNKMTCYTPEVLPVVFTRKSAGFHQQKRGDVNNPEL